MRPHAFLIAAGALASILAVTGCGKPADTTPAAADSAAAASTNAPTPSASADSAAPAAAGTTAAGFVTAAANSDMYEVAAGKIAVAKSKNAEVKKFAARMVHDHSATTAEVKTIIARPGMSVTPPAAMDDRHKGMVDALNAAAPADFDKTYINQQVAGHDEAIALFDGYAAGGDNDALKKFAAKTSPTIKDHDAMAKKIQTSMK